MYKVYKKQDRIPLGKTRYQFEIRFDDKRYRQLIVCQKSVVKNIYRDWENQILDGSVEFRDYRLFETLDLYLKYVQEKKSEQAYQNESRTVRLLKTYFNDMKLITFRRFHIEDYITWRKTKPLTKTLDNVTNATINREIAVISCFFNYCITRSYYNHVNPAYRLTLKEMDREIQLTSDQISELLTNARKQGEGIYTAVIIALLTGLRRNELFNLKWSDIDFQNSIIHLRAETTKGKKRRVVAMPDYLKDHLTEVRKKKPFTDKVFHGWQTTSKLVFEWNRLREGLSFKTLSNGLKIHFHDLRHVYAQSLRDAGVSLSDIQIFLGHSSVKTTESKYAQFGGKDAVSKVNKIAEIIPLKSAV